MWVKTVMNEEQWKMNEKQRARNDEHSDWDQNYSRFLYSISVSKITLILTISTRENDYI